MGRPIKDIQYLSSMPGCKTGQVFTRYVVDGKIRRKSFSWHPAGRSEKEALKLLQEFIANNSHN